jgi:hypothetical protein
MMKSTPNWNPIWEPIETAPKDKSKFLAFGYGHGNRVFSYDTNQQAFPMFSICSWRWHDGEKEVDLGNGTFRKEPCRVLEGWDCDWSFRPTHWTHLPFSPEDAEAALRGIAKAK